MQSRPVTIPEIKPDWSTDQRLRVCEALTAKALAAINRRDAAALHHIVAWAYNAACLSPECLNKTDNLSQLLMALSNPEK